MGLSFRRRCVAAVAFCLIPATLTGCGQSKPLSHQWGGRAAEPPARVAGIKIDDPDPSRQLVSTRFGVTISDARGEPINGAQVRLTLVMPDMAMPPNAVSCVRPSPAAPPGYYEGVGTFTMTGTWRIDATALVPVGKRLAATRTVQVR